MRIRLIGIFVVFLLLFSCNKTTNPKPRGYFRIDLPAKEYQNFVSDGDFSFDYPVYGIIDTISKEKNNNYLYYNIRFPEFKSTIYLTYFKNLKEDSIDYIAEDLRTNIVYKHIIKADDIIETPFEKEENRVYGIIYDIKGNTASNVNFYITDYSSHFLSGSLYFEARPNKDSLAPVITFFRQDILHLLETFEWK